MEVGGSENVSITLAGRGRWVRGEGGRGERGRVSSLPYDPRMMTYEDSSAWSSY